MSLFHFEEIGLSINGSAVTVGSFNGRFATDDDGLVDWIELDGYATVGRSHEPGTITLPADDPLYERLAEKLLTEFADEIAEREADSRPYIDRYADFRFDKQHYGVR